MSSTTVNIPYTHCTKLLGPILEAEEEDEQFAVVPLTPMSSRFLSAFEIPPKIKPKLFSELGLVIESGLSSVGEGLNRYCQILGKYKPLYKCH